MKVVKVRSPFIIEVNEALQDGSKIELSIWNNGNSIPTVLSGVTITGTAGQFSCTAATFATGNTLTISGSLAGTGTITGYTSPKTYYVIATNGTTTFTLSETLGGTAIVTTAGTPTGLTYITQISGFYSLSKSIPSTSQRSTSYNVSNYVKEFIDNIKPTKISSSPSYEDSNEWVKFKVKRYKLVGGTYTLLDNIDYAGVNGFTTYTQGVNAIVDYYTTGFLSNKLISKNIIKSSSSLKNYVNWIGEMASGYRLDLIYVTLNNSYSVTQSITGLNGIYNFKIPLTKYPTDVNFILGNRLDVNLYDAGSTQIGSDSVYVYINEECKYTPVECTFINRYGGWEVLTFFKQQTNSISVKGTDYKLMPSAINYNTSKGQVKSFNINGNQTIKLNTGFVDENYSELITDLLLSETVLLDEKPVLVKTQGSDLKTSLKDKLINYEIEFEYAYNLINDVV